MKKYIYTISACLVAFCLLVTPIAFANEEDANSESTSQKTQEEIQKEKAELQARIDKKKAEFQTKLTAIAEARIKERCQAAQGLIKSHGTRLSNGATKRSKAYERLQQHLGKLIDKLKAKGVDTSVLEQQKAVLDGKITQFNTDLTAYKQQISDLHELDCKTDPTAFKAALEAAKTARQSLANQAADIKAYVKDTIKPTLESIRSSLEAQENNSDAGDQE